MNRLDKIDYNYKQWSLTENKNYEYCLTNNISRISYSISGKISGIQQIDDSTFLIHRPATSNIENISRYRYTDEGAVLEFHQYFYDFTFLTEDTILFDNKSVYSISKNSEISEFNWLKRKGLQVCTDDNGNPSVLLVQECVALNEYVQVLVDIETFKPVSRAYSTLRDSFIPLTDSITFDKLVKEDIAYEKIINHYFIQRCNDLINKGKQTLLEEFKKNS